MQQLRCSRTPFAPRPRQGECLVDPASRVGLGHKMVLTVRAATAPGRVAGGPGAALLRPGQLPGRRGAALPGAPVRQARARQARRLSAAAAAARPSRRAAPFLARPLLASRQGQRRGRECAPPAHVSARGAACTGAPAACQARAGRDVLWDCAEGDCWQVGPAPRPARAR